MLWTGLPRALRGPEQWPSLDTLRIDLPHSGTGFNPTLADKYEEKVCGSLMDVCTLCPESGFPINQDIG